LQDLWSNLSGHGVQVVAIHVGSTEAAAQAWMTGHGVTFPAIQDDTSFSIFASYSPGYYGVPHSYVIGRDMVIRKDLLGSIDCHVLEGHVMDVVYMRDPIDVEMVMDVSDSMNDPSPSDPGGDSKLTMMKQAATMITDFLNDNGQVDDRMGLVWFTDDASEYQNPTGEKLLPVQIHWTDLRTQINTHGTGTCTAMGAGLQTAFDTLSPSTQKPFVILCTDGMQNIEPKVTKVGSHYEMIDSGGWLCGGHSSVVSHPGVDIITYNTCIHTIGIGITATYAALLQEIADATDGFYRGTNDPETDLDLIYFLDLCNCMAGGSPTVVHHSTGIFRPEEYEAVECFCLNRSIRKVTVMLSWRKSQGNDLTFWLYAPDGTLLDLHHEMKRFESHSLATIYLPRQQDGQELGYVGHWRMVIRGETQGAHADYHAMVIGEDREIKYALDFPKKMYEVRDLLPIRINLTELKEPIVKVNEILMEMVHLRVPLAELLAQYRVSFYELQKEIKKGRKQYRKDPVVAKLEAMASDPRFRKFLTPVRNQLSLQEGSLECKISEKEIFIPIALKQPGLHSFKVAIQCQTPGNGPICRTDMISVNVRPGKADPKQTRVSLTEISAKGLAGAMFHVTPKNKNGQLVGPGFGHEFKAMVGKQSLEFDIEDQLNGTYQIELLIPKKVQVKGKRTSVNIMFQGKLVWKGKV
jgi:hypothetical protein